MNDLETKPAAPPAFKIEGLQTLELDADQPLRHPPVVLSDPEQQHTASEPASDFLINAADPVAEARRQFAASDDTVAPEAPVEVDAGRSPLSKFKLAGIAAFLVIGAITLRVMTHAAPASAPVTTASTATPAPASTASAVPSTALPTASLDAPLPGGTEIYLTDSPAAQMAADDIESEITALANVWPVALRTCAAKGLTLYDRGICASAGPETYFRCASDGRRWKESATCPFPE